MKSLWTVLLGLGLAFCFAANPLMGLMLWDMAHDDDDDDLDDLDDDDLDDDD
jgi:hypothetical protein